MALAAGARVPVERWGGGESEQPAEDRGEQRQPVLLDGRRVSNVEWREEEVESRYEATFAVGLVIVLQVTLALVSLGAGWKLIGLPGWVWLISVGPETALLLALAWAAPPASSRADGPSPHRRARARRRDHHGKRACTRGSDRITAERGGEARRGAAAEGRHDLGHERDHVRAAVLGVRPRRPDPPPRGFQFPQDENPTLAEPDWHPRLADYVYISFTNAVAFSPTDAMPLTGRVKMMMLAESAISATTVLLVAERAVNILR